jgi:DNA-binding transcriptional LysR family regulator
VDKLRSLQYFAAAADEGSFSGAARRVGVSVAAVAKLITALERNLGLRLFERHAHGLTLTAGGNAYLDACRPALAMLADADEQASAVSSRARGTVVVGVPMVIAQQCLAASLPRFNALYPDIQLDLRLITGVTEEETRGVDVLLGLGWPQSGDLVQRQLGANSFVVCASPSYWAAHGVPQHPRDLEKHNCLCIRGSTGTLLDLWRFRHGDEEVAVTVRGWLVTDNAYRDVVRNMAIVGGGVARLLEWTKREGHEISRGLLVPALTDWEPLDAPPINLIYPPSVRRIPRVRLFIDFVTQLFRDIEQQREVRTPVSPMPRWVKATRARASDTRNR